MNHIIQISDQDIETMRKDGVLIIPLRHSIIDAEPVVCLDFVQTRRDTQKQ